MRTVLGLALFIFMSVSARADIYKHIEFRSKLASESTLSIPIKEWAPEERAVVVELFRSLEKSHPNLFLRAAGPGTIMLYRAESSPSHPSGAWVRRRHESSFIFTDLFFAGSGKNHLGVEYINWLFIHEISHLADPVDQIARSDEWSAIIANRLLSVSQDLSQQGLSLRQAMFKQMDLVAKPYGFPSMYAAISRHEALAEFSAAYYFGKPVPNDVEEFLRSNLYEPPRPEINQLALLYRSANIEFRNKQFKKAIKILNRAIKLSPSFSQGLYLRGFANLNAENYRKSMKDFKRALNILPKDDRKVRREALEARSWAGQKKSDYNSVISDFSELIAEYPEQSKYYYGRAIAYVKISNLALAKQDLEKALQLNPKNKDQINFILEQM